MAISNEAIMDRMMAEINKAKTAMHEQRDWKLHIAHIQLLSDLLLDEQRKTTEQIVTPPESKQVKVASESHVKESDSSIFDF